LRRGVSFGCFAAFLDSSCNAQELNSYNYSFSLWLEYHHMERAIYTPPSGPPQGPGPNSAIYGIMGEDNIFKMMLDLYRELEKSPIRGLFPSNMEEASKKSAAFFVTILGGPPLYMQKYGPPRMRARHRP